MQQNIDETEALTQAGRFEERTFKAIDFNVILGDATHNKVLATVVKAMSSVLRGFIASAGPQPHDPVIALRRTLLERMRARDEKGATECMAAYFDGLNAHLLRKDAGTVRRPAGGKTRALPVGV
jgi:DNA-binding FadR family transcriptional regulator